MKNEYGHKFEYAEQKGGFIEKVMNVIGESSELMVIGYNPDAENPIMVASNMDRTISLEIIKSLKSALEVVDANGN